MDILACACVGVLACLVSVVFAVGTHLLGGSIELMTCTFRGARCTFLLSQHSMITKLRTVLIIFPVPPAVILVGLNATVSPTCGLRSAGVSR